jgi:hypothetical protein
MSVLQQSQSGGSSKEHEDADIHFAYTECFANMSIDTDRTVGGSFKVFIFSVEKS